MAIKFKNIPHVERKVFRRTSMNEILVFFAYEPVSIASCKDALESFLKKIGLSISKLQMISNEEKDDLLEYQDQNVTVSLTSAGAFVNIPVTKYRDFTSTEFVWKHLEQALLILHVNPIVWSFSKGNKFVFIKPVTEDIKDKLLELILSNELRTLSGGKGIFVEESIEKSSVFSCRYGFEKYKDKDALSLKTMITHSSYQVTNLTAQVMAMNELMFDVWHWCMSQRMLEFMNSPKE